MCRKIGLRPGMTVLDIGCGWGSFMKYAAERYGVSCVGVSVSNEQTKLGRQLCAGLPIEFRLQDYHDIEGRYDRIVSIKDTFPQYEAASYLGGTRTASSVKWLIANAICCDEDWIGSVSPTTVEVCLLYTSPSPRD